MNQEVRAAQADPDRRQDAKIARGFAPNPSGGILVQATPPGSVAGELRLEPGDVVVSVNGEAVSSPADFVSIYRAHGLPTQLTVLRGGREIHLH